MVYEITKVYNRLYVFSETFVKIGRIDLLTHVLASLYDIQGKKKRQMGFNILHLKVKFNLCSYLLQSYKYLFICCGE